MINFLILCLLLFIARKPLIKYGTTVLKIIKDLIK